MPGTDVYGQGISLPLLSDAPDAQQLGADLSKIIGRTVMVFDSASHRGATLVGTAAPTEGMFSYLKDSNVLEYYSGSAWRPGYEAMPGIGRGSKGWATGSGTLGIGSGLTLVHSVKFSFSCEAIRRYRATAGFAWTSTITGLSAGLRQTVRYVAGTSIASDGSGTTLLVQQTTGCSAQSITVPSQIQYEFNGPLTGDITFGLFANSASGSGNQIASDSPASLAVSDIGPAI